MATTPVRARLLGATAVLLVLLSAVVSSGSPPAGAIYGTTDAAVGHVGAQGRVGASPVRSSMTMVMKP